jgi:hypothetical protein
MTLPAPWAGGLGELRDARGKLTDNGASRTQNSLLIGNPVIAP